MISRSVPKKAPKRRKKGRSESARVYNDPLLKRLRCPRGFLTGTRILEESGITAHEFRSLCKLRKLRATRQTYMKERLYPEEMVREVLKAELGVDLYASKEVTATAPEVTYSVEETKAVLEAIASSKPLTSLVLTHAMPLHRIEAIAAQCNEMNGSLVIPKDMILRLAGMSLPCTLPFPDADELEYVLKELVKRGRCECGGVASFCSGCARRRFEPRSSASAPIGSNGAGEAPPRTPPPER